MISAIQSKMARAALGWSASDLAKHADVGINTVLRFETEKQAPRRSTLAVIKQAFESAGVDFISENGGGPGVRLTHKVGNG